MCKHEIRRPSPFGSLTQRPCTKLCDLTTCYSIKSAWFQRLILKCDDLLSNFAFRFNLRRYTMDQADMSADQAAEVSSTLDSVAKNTMALLMGGGKKGMGPEAGPGKMDGVSEGIDDVAKGLDLAHISRHVKDAI